MKTDGGRYLASEEDSPEAIVELPRVNDGALDQHTGTDGGCHPPARAYRHLEEPLLEWKVSHEAIAALYRCHGGACLNREDAIAME